MDEQEMNGQATLPRTPFEIGQSIEVTLLISQKSHRTLKQVRHVFDDCTLVFENMRRNKKDKKHWRVVRIEVGDSG